MYHTIRMSFYYLLSLEALLTYRYARIAKCTIVLYVHTTPLLTHIFFASQQRKIRKAGTLFVSCSHLAKFAQLMLCFMHISFHFDSCLMLLECTVVKYRMSYAKIFWRFCIYSIKYFVWFYKSFCNFGTIKLVCFTFWTIVVLLQ